jgi:signal transduction histidine kinase
MQVTVSSVRGRILCGAAFWTIGLVMFLAIVLTAGHGGLAVPGIAIHSAILLVLASGCMVAGFSMVRGALAPFDRLRSRLAGVRRGSENRLRGEYPTEVQPLVDEVNALLSHSENAVLRAMAKAGDLAHGLKTPLAVLSNEAEHLADAGDPDLAASIAEQVEKMRRAVEYHLAHARAAGSGAAIHATAPLSESVEGLVRALLRQHAHRGIEIGRIIDPGHVFRGRREDLDEMLGNLLDNAFKWSRSRVAVASARDGEGLVVTVDDDGPGVAESERGAVMNRGVRADEAVPGSGLGLAIVRDLADLYGGSIALGESPLGGLRARLTLPAAPPRD